MRKVFILFLFLSCLFAACGEFTVTEETTARNAGFVTLSAFEEGRILKPGEKIKYGFSFTEDASSVVSYRISVVDLVSDEAVFEGEQIRLKDAITDQVGTGHETGFGEEMSVPGENGVETETTEAEDYNGNTTVPEMLPDGYYAFVFSFSDTQGNEIGSVRASFFVSSVQLKVNSLGSYPAVIYPGGESLLYTDITAPDGFDSDVVWTCNGVEIFRTRLKNMAPAVKWRAPADKTAVEMSVGIYPCDPPVGQTFSFAPPVSLSSTIFISASQPVESGDFRPDSEYDLLFHFRGETNDYSPYAKDRRISVKGTPQLAFDSNVFGYSFADGAAVEVAVDDESVLGYEGTGFVPSTVDFRLNLKSESSGRIFSVKDSDDKTVFSLSKNNGKVQLTAELSSVPVTQSLNLADYTLTDLTRLSFSVFQNVAEKQFSFVWSLDGYSVSRTAFGYDSVRRIDGKTLIIGGDDGYTGVVDELGIFRVSDRISDSLFADAVRKRFGASCLLADDFIGTSCISSYRKFPELQPAGVITVVGGDELETVACEVPDGRFSVQIAVAEDGFSGGSVDVKAVSLGDGNEWTAESVCASLDLTDGHFSAASGDFAFIPSGSLFGLYRLDFQKMPEGWVCEFGGKKFPVNIPDGAAVAVSASAGTGESFTIDSLVLLGTLAGQADVYKTPVSLIWQP